MAGHGTAWLALRQLGSGENGGALVVNPRALAGAPQICFLWASCLNWG